MAIKGAIPMGHGDVFPHGCYVVGEVEAMRDFDRSTKDQAVQAVDRDSGRAGVDGRCGRRRPGGPGADRAGQGAGAGAAGPPGGDGRGCRSGRWSSTG